MSYADCTRVTVSESVRNTCTCIQSVTREDQIIMSKTKCISIWILMVLVSFAEWGLGFRVMAGLIGTNTLVNNAGDMTIRNMARSGSVNQPDFGDVPLTMGRSYEYLVVTGITSVTSWCKITNSTGNYDQQVLSWSNDPQRIQPVACTPDCQWTIDASGFSVTNPATQQLEFLVGWNGPLTS